MPNDTHPYYVLDDLTRDMFGTPRPRSPRKVEYPMLKPDKEGFIKLGDSSMILAIKNQTNDWTLKGVHTPGGDVVLVRIAKNSTIRLTDPSTNNTLDYVCEHWYTDKGSIKILPNCPTGIELSEVKDFYSQPPTGEFRFALNLVQAYATKKFRGKFYLTPEGSNVHIRMTEEFLASLMLGVRITGSEDVASLLEPFEANIEARCKFPNAEDLVGFGRSVLGENASGFLFKKSDAFIERVSFDSIKGSHGISQCQECGFVDLSEQGLEGDNGFVCRECKKAHTHKCGVCDSSFYSQTPSLFTTMGKNKPICKTCVVKDCYECGHCSRDDKTVFHILGEKKTCPHVGIKNHSYAPKYLAKLGDKKDFPFHLGVELELHVPDVSGLIRHMTEAWPGMFMFKSDSSIRNGGVECVSIPMGRDIWRERFDPTLIQDFEGVRAEGHGGIHIHADRDAFSDSQIRSIMTLLSLAKSKVEAIAGRANSDYARIIPHDRIESRYTGYDLSKDQCGGKYDGINLLHKHTLEFRIFDSTVKNSLFQKNLDFICAAWAWSSAGMSSSITWADFKKFVTAEKSTFVDLHNFIERSAL